ncbi:MAG: hypothetical protein JO284_18320 [Planctomycetaceae bacterium]|nr:hypothetical protein [Planctomycetaceae bacterium]
MGRKKEGGREVEGKIAIRTDVDPAIYRLLDQAASHRGLTKAAYIRTLLLADFRKLKLLSDKPPGRPGVEGTK